MTPSVFKRLAAAVYDGLLVLAVLFIASFIFLWLFGDATQTPKRHFYQAYLLLCCMVYFVGFWLRGGQTLAMRTWRFKLVSAQGKLTMRQALLRFVLAPIGLILFFSVWFDKEQSFLHDRLAKTRLLLC